VKIFSEQFKKFRLKIRSREIVQKPKWFHLVMTSMIIFIQSPS